MKKILFAALLTALAMNVDAKKKFAITMTGENLSTLTQVTDNAEPCMDPFGGDNGSPLYFAVRENKKYYNIYKKANPFSAAMSQKTSGKNFNRNPWYNPVTDKLMGSMEPRLFHRLCHRKRTLLERFNGWSVLGTAHLQV